MGIVPAPRAYRACEMSARLAHTRTLRFVLHTFAAAFACPAKAGGCAGILWCGRLILPNTILHFLRAVVIMLDALCAVVADI